MRFAHHGPAGSELPIVADSTGPWHDLSSVTPAITPEFIGGHHDIDLSRLPQIEPHHRFGAPIHNIGKIICVGMNYQAHVEETGGITPDEPVLFLKSPEVVIGPTDTVLIPPGSLKTDWEVELAVVIGQRARYLDSHESAAACVAGYAISNDVSEREYQMERGGQWDKGKNCETFNPFGPWLVSADEVADPQDLGLRLWVNGELRQNSTTKDMIFGVNHIVWYVSQFMVLHPGDVINTGTPSGIALGLPDQPFLRPGDVVELEIDRLGRQRQVCEQAR